MYTALLALVLLGGALLADRILLASRPDFYFAAGLPLSEEPLPLPRPPDASEGRTATVRWDRELDRARFWVAPGEGNPAGLHGTVDFVPHRGGWRLVVRWCPSWASILAPLWLGSLAAVRRDFILVLVACGLLYAILHVHRAAATRAAAELRWAWVRD